MTRRKYFITIHLSRTGGVHEEKAGVSYPKMPKTSQGDTIKVFTKKYRNHTPRKLLTKE